MSKTPKLGISAVFGSLAIILFLGLVGGFYYEYMQLESYANEINQSASDALNKVNEIEQLRSELSKYSDPLEKAASITSTSNSYKTQAVKDINYYANKTGVSISSFNFSPTVDNSLSTTVVVNGTKLYYIAAELNNPVSYNNFLKFLQGIESNLPKMQVMGIDISTDASGYINVEPLIIGVYTN